MDNSDDNSNNLNLNIEAVTVLKVSGIILLMLLVWQFLAAIVPILLLVLAAIIFTIALDPIVNYIAKSLRIKHRTVAVGITFSIIIIALIAFLFLVIPPVLNQLTDFTGDLSGEVAEFAQQDNWISNTIRRYELDQTIIDASDDISSTVTENLDSLLSVLQTVSSAIVAFILIMVMTFMMLAESQQISQQFKRYMSPEKFTKWQGLYGGISKVINGYVTGQLFIAILGGSITFLFLSILPLPGSYSEVAMAAIVTVASLVPLIGIIVGAGIVVILTALIDINLGLAVLIFFIVYQQIENTTIQPIIQGHRSNLSTLQVLLATLIGAKIAGVIGVLLSVPLAACIKVIVLDYFHTHQQQLKEEYQRFRQKVRPKKPKSTS